MKAIVAERGQVTIPKFLHQKLGFTPKPGLKPGTVLDLHVEKAMLIGVKRPSQDPIEKVYGCLKTTR